MWNSYLLESGVCYSGGNSHKCDTDAEHTQRVYA